MSRLAIADASASILANSEVNAALVDSPDGVLEQVLAEADALITRSGLERSDIHQVVASIPAPVDFTHGVTGHSHIMSGWEGFPLRATLGSHFDAAALLDNNANLMALGAAATLHPDQLPLLYVHCSLGIGAGMVTADGLIHRGADGSAGDVGHLKVGGRPGVQCLCGKTGCVGAAASLRAVLKELGLEVGGGAEGSEVGQIRSLVKAGERRAGAVLRDAASRLGELTAALVDMFNPRTVVVRGELVGLGDDVLASRGRGVPGGHAHRHPKSGHHCRNGGSGSRDKWRSNGRRAETPWLTDSGQVLCPCVSRAHGRLNACSGALPLTDHLAWVQNNEHSEPSISFSNPASTTPSYSSRRTPPATSGAF